MDSQAIETTTDQLTLRSIDEGIKQATDPIRRRVEEKYALLVGQPELETAGKSGASGSRRDKASASPSRHRHVMLTGAHQNTHRCNCLHRVSTLDSFKTCDYDQPEDDDDELMNAITNVSNMIQSNTHQHKLLQTQVTTAKEQKERYIELENISLNHIGPFRTKTTEEVRL